MQLMKQELWVPLKHFLRSELERVSSRAMMHLFNILSVSSGLIIQVQSLTLWSVWASRKVSLDFSYFFKMTNNLLVQEGSLARNSKSTTWFWLCVIFRNLPHIRLSTES